MSRKSITDEQFERLTRMLAELARLVEEGSMEFESTMDGLQRLIEDKRLVLANNEMVDKGTSSSDIVVVPDMSAVELTAAANRDLKLTHLDSDFAAWDYYQSHDGSVIEGRGLKFEPLIVTKKDIKPWNYVLPEVARAYFRRRGYFGHAGAFTQWRRQSHAILGLHASIPEDSGCWRDSDGRLFVPSSYSDGRFCLLNLHRIDHDWCGNDVSIVSFVAFRVVS